MDFKDKIVVVTGATRGLGLELAKGFSAAGAKVVVSDLDEARLKAAAEEIGALAIPADVTDESQVKNLARQALEVHGRIDVWVNNAGLWIPHARINQNDMAAVQKMYAVNVFGLMHGCRATLPIFSERGSGTILNIISTSALDVKLHSAAYGGSKAAAAHYTRGLRLEVATDESGKDIRIFAAYPGPMQTEIFGAHQPEHYSEFMEPTAVAVKIVSNLELENPEVDLVIRQA